MQMQHSYKRIGPHQAGRKLLNIIQNRFRCEWFEVLFTYNVSCNKTGTSDITSNTTVMGQGMILDWGFTIQITQKIPEHNFLVGSKTNTHNDDR